MNKSRITHRTQDRSPRIFAINKLVRQAHVFVPSRGYFFDSAFQFNAAAVFFVAKMTTWVRAAKKRKNRSRAQQSQHLPQPPQSR
jgi:hypothetical protein